MTRLTRFIPFAISLAITPFALFAGLISVGAGHGDYIAAILLFPFAFLTGFVIKPLFFCAEFGDCFPRDLMIFASAIIQFPLYGLLFSLLNKRVMSAIVIVAVHLSLSLGIWIYLRNTGFL